MPIVRLDNFQQFSAINVLSDPGHIAGPKIVPQCAQITLTWNHVNGKFFHVVLAGRYAGAFAGTVAQCNSILTALTTGASWTALATYIHPTAALTSVQIRNIAIADQPILSSSASGQVGTSTGSPLPGEVAAVITLRTALTGQANRGRAYISGWGTNALGTVDTIAAATVTALQNWANTIPAAITSGGYTWCLALPARSAYTGTGGRLHPARDARTQDITSQTVRDNHWDTQRRRGLK